MASAVVGGVGNAVVVVLVGNGGVNDVNAVRPWCCRCTLPRQSDEVATICVCFVLFCLGIADASLVIVVAAINRIIVSFILILLLITSLEKYCTPYQEQKHRCCGVGCC